MVVFGSIINEGYVNHGSERLYCVFNKNNNACNYGTTIGLIAFLACIFFIILDMKFQQISSIKDRKKAVMLDIGFSGKQKSMPKQTETLSVTAILSCELFKGSGNDSGSPQN